MGMTLTEKIIARHAGKHEVSPGEFVTVDVDFCMANDATMRLNIDLVENVIGARKVFDPNRIVLFMDHQVPTDSIDTAEVHKLSREFAARFGIHNFYDSEGICHQVLLEKYVEPGMLVAGADSHTNSHGAVGCVAFGMGSTDIAAIMAEGKTWLKVPPTVQYVLTGRLPGGVYSKDLILQIIGRFSSSGLNYKAAEFSGDGLEYLSTGDRFTVCNMTTEMGAKSSIIAPDEETYKYFSEIRGESLLKNKELFSDSTAEYEKVYEIALSEIEPMASCPHTVDNVDTVSNLMSIQLDQAFLGSCTNGRIEDLRIAANILKGKHIAKNLRFLVTPASRSVYRKALKEGLISVFLEAGAMINHPSCSTCWGASQGVMSAGERMISSGNRNFKGRAGSGKSEIYLASPATVAASAIEGKIADPRNYIQ